MITQQQLKEHLSYDSATGVFTNLRNKCGRGGGIGSVAGTIKKGYVCIKLLNKRYYAHRLAWLYVHGEFPSNEIDHINNDKTDNRLCNLRDVPHAINQLNRIDTKKNGAQQYTKINGKTARLKTLKGQQRPA